MSRMINLCRNAAAFPSLRLREIGREGSADANDCVRELRHVQCIQTDLSERYSKGELACHLHAPWRFLSSVEQETQPGCAVLQALSGLDDEVPLDGGGMTSIIRAQIPIEPLCESLARKEAVGRIDDAVLVSIGKAGEDGEGMGVGVPSVVRLRLLDECPVFRAQTRNAPGSHPLELSLRLGRDRELSAVVRDPAIEQGHLPDQMIERRSKIVDRVSKDDPKAQRRFLSNLKPLAPFPGVRIEFTDREVGLRFLVEEGIHFGAEFIELLFCPVVLGLDSVERVIHAIPSLSVAGEPQRKQKTKPAKGKPIKIPVPTRGEFDAAIAKVAPPAGRKDPAGKDQPLERSD